MIPKYPKRPPQGHLKVYKDGREVLKLTTKAGMDEYVARKRQMWDRQKRLCCICGKHLNWADATFEHQAGRGMGGSRRDDRIEIDGKPYNGTAHFTCNAEKASRRMNYNDDAAWLQ